jgi:uncharacterized membrane protein|tara:strand:+ start:13376 stop:13747 length:372 start_codon:yes stop_codon:yes gene_type:complete
MEMGKRKVIIFLGIIISMVVTSMKAQDIDKKAHYFAGGFVGAITYNFVYEETQDRNKALLSSIASALLVGTIKEIADSQEQNNYFDGKDLLATGLGGLSIGLTFDLINKKNEKRFYYYLIANK